VNTGSGGGGGSQNYGAGAGGSGVVILRYKTAKGGACTIGAGLTGTSTTSGDDTIVTITAGTGNVSFG
jgi:hypothetical protein